MYNGTGNTLYATGNTLFFVMDIHEHGVSTFLVYLDLIVSATPMRVAHVIYGVLFTGIYVCFSAGFWAVDRHPTGPLYLYLDWDAPVQTAYFVTGALGVIAALYIVAYVVYKLRTSCYRCTCRHRSGAPLQLPRQPQMEYIELGKEDEDGNDVPLADESF